MKALIIIQARMTSTRLPGKILKSILGKPMLEFEIERLRRMKSKLPIMIATTRLADDDPTVVLAQRLGLSFYRGSESDVLSRYYEAAKSAQVDAIVRVTADCPLIDPEVVEEIYSFFAATRADYASNTINRTYPRGLDAEVFTFKALEEAYKEATTSYDREHVTPFIRNKPTRYKVQSLSLVSEDFAKHRWTVDTEEDFELIRRIFEDLYPRQPEFSWRDVLALLEHHPEWIKLNAHIEQKA